MKRFLLIVLALVFAALVALFAIRNTASVTVDLLITRQEGPVILWLLAAVCIGAGLTVICLVPGWWRQRGERRRLRRELATARDECDRLRRAPLRDH